MALSERILNDVRCWYFDFRVNHQRKRGWLKPVSEMSRRQAQAEVRRLKAAAMVDQANLLEARADGFKPWSIKTVIEKYEDYLKDNKPGTWKNTRFLLKRLKFFFAFPVITDDEKLAYQKKRLAEGVKGATVNRELEAARAAFNRAIKLKRWKGDNPFSTFERYPEATKTRFLKQDELCRLLDECMKTEARGRSPFLYRIVLTAVLLGLRLERVLMLRKEEVDFDNGVVLVYATGTKKYSEDLETPLAPALYPVLEPLAEATKSGYLFENPRTHQPPKSIKRAFKNALKNSGIHAFRFHDLRHTFGTYAHALSNDLNRTQKLLGHKDIKTTLRYAHVLDEQKRETIDQFSTFVSALVDKKTDNDQAPSAKNASKSMTLGRQRTCFGSKKSLVRIQSSRPDFKGLGDLPDTEKKADT